MNENLNPGPQARVDQLISAQVERTPDAVAAVHDARSLSYRELGTQSDRAAARLRAFGVTRGELVGVHLERSLEMLVAVVAVMKAGAAYVPLDPDFPPDRLGHMVADAGLAMVVTQPGLSDVAPPGDYRSIDIAELLQVEVDAPADEPSPTDAGDGSDLIYVLYTSGSTGRPKGVALEHRNVVNFLLGMQGEPGMTPQDRIVAVTTLSFDIAALELYLPLVTGATVVIASRHEAADGAGLRALMDSHGATVMQATPTTWRLLIDAGWRGSPGFKGLCGGETLPPDLARMLLDRCGELWNMYGPTETAIWSTVFRVTDSAAAPLPIGRPIANTRVYVLDRSSRPVPMGILGEIFIAGAGVARGYLNRPELTAEKFLRDPYSNEPGARMYRTGDLGRYLPDGNLEFRSRVDNQVKIRGFRVELGDVEAAVESHAAVKQAVAKIVEFRPGDPRLVAYVLPFDQAPTDADLRDYLRKRLPHYMVPQHLPVVREFPMTPNGKVDRNALPPPLQAVADPAVEASLSAAARHPDPRVNYLGSVWSELLGVAVKPGDNFFDLGGHSMLAVQMVNRVAADTGVRLKLVRLGSQSLNQIAQDLPAAISVHSAAAGIPPSRGASLIRSARRMFAPVRPRE